MHFFTGSGAYKMAETELLFLKKICFFLCDYNDYSNGNLTVRNLVYQTNI